MRHSLGSLPTSTTYPLHSTGSVPEDAEAEAGGVGGEGMLSSYPPPSAVSVSVSGSFTGASSRFSPLNLRSEHGSDEGRELKRGDSTSSSFRSGGSNPYELNASNQRRKSRSPFELPFLRRSSSLPRQEPSGRLAGQHPPSPATDMQGIPMSKPPSPSRTTLPPLDPRSKPPLPTREVGGSGEVEASMGTPQPDSRARGEMNDGGSREGGSKQQDEEGGETVGERGGEGGQQEGDDKELTEMEMALKQAMFNAREEAARNAAAEMASNIDEGAEGSDGEGREGGRKKQERETETEKETERRGPHPFFLQGLSGGGNGLNSSEGVGGGSLKLITASHPPPVGKDATRKKSILKTRTGESETRSFDGAELARAQSLEYADPKRYHGKKTVFIESDKDEDAVHTQPSPPRPCLRPSPSLIDAMLRRDVQRNHLNDPSIHDPLTHPRTHPVPAGTAAGETIHAAGENEARFTSSFEGYGHRHGGEGGARVV